MKALCIIFLLAAPAAAEPTMAGVVKSLEWRVKRAPAREEEFIGDVSYKAGPDRLRSDWALFRHEPRTWEARGNIRVERRLDSGEIIEARGERAEYDQKTGKGSLTGAADQPISFLRRPADGGPADHGSASRLDWRSKEQARLTGAVRLWGPRLEGWSDAAELTRPAAAPGRLTLSGGRPVLRLLEGGWTGAVKADLIEAFEKPDRLTADGRTVGWLRFKDGAPR